MRKFFWDAIIWWERRRFVFNIVLVAAGLCTIVIVEFIGARYAHPGEDVEEPLGLIIGGLAYGIAANLCYTAGWVTELMWSNAIPVVQKLSGQKSIVAG